MAVNDRTAARLALTASEVERGWVEFVCPEHGALVVAAPSCTVRCRCGRQARRSLNGTALKSRDIERLQKSVQRSLQTKGSISDNGVSRRRQARRRPEALVAPSQAALRLEEENAW